MTDQPAPSPAAFPDAQGVVAALQGDYTALFWVLGAVVRRRVVAWSIVGPTAFPVTIALEPAQYVKAPEGYVIDQVNGIVFPTEGAWVEEMKASITGQPADMAGSAAP